MSSKFVSTLLVAMALTATACGQSPSNPGKPDVTLANLNLVHGIFCPPESDNCRLPDRVDLMMEFVRASGCPDVITLQEIWRPSLELIEPAATEVCPFPYETVQGERLNQVDDETVLSRYPLEKTEQLDLFGDFRRVLLTRITHPSGPLDVYSTHLASSADAGNSACVENCPQECRDAGVDTVRDCQAVQLVDFVRRTHDVSNAALVTGDMNARPGSFVYEQFVGQGWLDTYLEAGNPECNPDTGIGCTSGREDELLTDLESPELEVRVRIDFIFLVPATAGSSCQPELLPANDLGPGTQLWTEVPNPFVPNCGPLPDAICWPSDHTGVQVAYRCS
ncbi:MAG: endonuclease/exonuclease/phosphatase family protein [Candidatus Binatia bacterium]|nr:endonuclease/exonuclease/phosphatase family protein [Candidatus Binatia bacterium]